MQIIPAIDIKDGKCVRLKQGAFDEVTTYGDDPVEIARRWDSSGAPYIHIVDLDGALAGEPVNREPIGGILKTVHAKIQVGGGIRSVKAIDAYLSLGVNRVILGTAALEDPHLVKEACKKYPERIAVGIDARDGKVAVRGWAETSETTAIELSKRLADSGVAAIIYTDIARDGMLNGPNFSAIEEMVAASPVPIIASGGISSLADLERLRRIPNVSGAIIGKALYNGNFTLEQALGA